MVPVSVAPANQYADTPSGIPDPATKGPDWILIGTEGGFMPKPVVVPQQPIGYNLDPAYFNFGIVNQHSLFLGSAERADVVVDFSAYAGKTLILYNDSPAPVPAGAAPYDFYTGIGDQMDGGGAPNTQPGYGPNTRTIMQIRVAEPQQRRHLTLPLRTSRRCLPRQPRSGASSKSLRTRSSYLRPPTTPPTTTRSRRLLRNSIFRSPIQRRPSGPSTRPGCFSLRSQCRWR